MKGFTLLEVLISLAILFVCLSLGVPSLLNMQNTYMVDKQVITLKKQLNYARFQAIHLGTRVTVCPLDKFGKCQSNWKNGYSIFVDNQKMGLFTEESDLLLVKNQLSNNLSLKYNGGKKIVFDSIGTLDSGSGTFQFCLPTDTKAIWSRALIVSLAGRVRSSYDIDGDGVDEKYYSNKKSDLTCS
ncbi:type II transport protein GspH [Catenovulum sp. SM1970]|uniref:GspH/FimT family pseudopilin n=1 Tax=Marinifaba aquimaris TaxID=2741323 RepID=UPI001573DA40|nr:GspH/FimT family pseudopilin [Marinifaba aquimaris]NTS77162.1 type II transport protein GspH [Marinifaba aquimaris]